MKHYTAERFQSTDTLGHLVAQSHLSLRTRLDQVLVPYELTSAQWIVLRKLGRGDYRTATELACGLNQDAAAITRMLDRLEAKGLVRRVRSATDRRVVELQLTEVGAALMPSLAEPAVQVMNEVLADFSREECEQLHRLLRRLIDNLQHSIEAHDAQSLS
jgi:MarR family transcriptional regulator, multiple antibiotic resistance protein MarR